MIHLHQLGYVHPNRELLFDQLHLSIPKYSKAGLIGANGSGKSTLLKLIAGQLQPYRGSVVTEGPVYYVPQHFGQFERCTLAEALGVGAKWKALHEILGGEASLQNLETLNDDWELEQRVAAALNDWQLPLLPLDTPLAALSGGQKTRLFLAGMALHPTAIVLLDEPSNHLDGQGRRQLYEWIGTSRNTLLVVSHDRTLLELLPQIYELSPQGIRSYGGNYAFYEGQKALEQAALEQDLRNKESALRKARDTERETRERKQKLDARGRKKQEKAGLPTIVMKSFKNAAERSTAKLKADHAEKREALQQELQALREAAPDLDTMKLGFDASDLPAGKTLLRAEAINFGYDHAPLWLSPLSFQVMSGARIALQGPNGSGKTTLIRLLLGELSPSVGSLQRADFRAVYVDQDYSLVNTPDSLYEQAMRFNSSGLQEHELKLRLRRFLFPPEQWEHSCQSLSGGERMRLLLCCLSIANTAPDMIVLDEPTNNLDLQNLHILRQVLQTYRGTLLMVSHDSRFLEELGVEQFITVQAPA